MKILDSLILITLLLVSPHINATDKKVTNKVDEGPYYYSTTVEGSYDEVLARLKAALKDVEFGIVSELKMNETLNEKLNTNLQTYVVLGICNPDHAHKALLAEDNIGLMLPCKGLIRLVDEGKYAISLQNPEKTLSVVNNPKLEKIGKIVSKSFKEALKVM